ncbi:MAG: N-acetylmuramoyl-L-alanine amidase, partial [Proteobacteria bacterium]|nr:N-acetylmuramoyl-L-alanine amidase [Pseudomonadota bacterium]
MRLKRIMSGFLFCVAAMFAALPNAEATSICIDPGHGGSDPGAVGCGLRETDINLAVSLKLQALLTKAGYTVHMTRTTETAVALASRTSFANSKGVKTLASIHTNSFTNPAATGIETFCYTGTLGSTSGTQAKRVQEAMLKVWALANRGAKEANFHMLRESNMPSTLSELGFIVNCDRDAVYLKSDAHRHTAAQAHCRAIVGQWGGTASACEGEGGTTPVVQGQIMGYVFEDVLTTGPRVDGASYTCAGVTRTSSSTAVTTFTVNPGSYTCSASKSGYNTATRTDCSPVVAGGTSWCSIAITKQAVVSKGTAKGTVRNSLTHGNIAATVSVTGGPSTSYSGSGEWSFSLDPNTYTIRASASGYDDGSVSCRVESGKTTDCPILLNPKKATLKGNVTDGATGSLMAATVSLGTQSISYLGSGEWSFTVDAGTYTINARADGYDAGSVNCTAGAGETKTCPIVLNRTAQKKGMVRGTIKDKETGALLTGTATLNDGTVYNYFASGEWQFYLLAGTHGVRGDSEGYESATVMCEVRADETTQCPIELSAKPGVVKGVVYDPTKQANVAAMVEIDGQTLTYDGISDWTVTLKAGQYEVKAQAEGYHPGRSTCEVKPGRTTECMVSMVALDAVVGTLTGIVHDARSRVLLIPATVSLEGGASIQYPGRDLWQFEHLAPGTYVVSVSSEGYYDNAASCSVVQGEPTYCAIALTARVDGENP